MMLIVLLVLGTLWLGWSNGANDNFKGVATLYGSRTLNYRAALAWSTVATVAGSMVSVLLAQGMVNAFSGQELIAAGLVNDSSLAAVGLAAAATVLLATLLGMPTSTTHALTGALVGTALVADPAGINTGVLLTKFAQPLLLSPLLAIGLTAGLYVVLHRLRVRSGITSQSCVCVGNARPVPVLVGASGPVGVAMTGQLEVSTGTAEVCVERYQGEVVGVQSQMAVDGLHYLSAGAVCFARAVNDTPKITAILLSAAAFGPGIGQPWVLGLVTFAVALGGLLQSRRVAETMSRRITDLNTGQGLTANLMTAALVLGASRLGLPVSTTHVSCGAIFGISAVNGKRDWRTIGQILAAWATTLPMGLALGAGLYWLLRTLGV
ncbi:MAG: inorganic phosphate transporter [Phycisphaeraceae bacterium]